jgi:XTP/dITP diphosphohydrolase
MSYRIILATRNAGKVKEIQSLLGGLPVEIRCLSDYPDLPEVLEAGETFRENALKKAREVFHAVQTPTLADDSGLEVYSLGMRPGIFSARYAGDDVDYEANNKKLLDEMKGLSLDQRGARFRCVAAFVGKGIERVVEGTCDGRIIEEPRGTGGFGYDPIFIPVGWDETFAELPLEIKNRISHRAKAFHLMEDILRGYLQKFP